MRKKFTLLFASLFLTIGTAWAQTVVGVLGEPTTTLTDGNYVLMAMSNKGNGVAGPCFYNTTVSGRNYQYDLNCTLNPGNEVLSKYVWTIDETTVDGVQHITVTNYDDNTKFFPADGAKNQNFAGTGKASLKTELKTIGDKQYFALTLDNAEIGYIHANDVNGVPNLSYWNEYNESGTCVKFTFYPVELDVAGENLPLERKSTFAVGDEMYIYSTCRVNGNADWTGFFTNNNGRASLIEEKPAYLFTEGNDPIWVIASLETLQTADETPKTYYKVTFKNKATNGYLGIGGVTTNEKVEAPQTFYISQWKNPVLAGDTESRKGVMPGGDVWSENVDGTALAPGDITANDPIWVVQAANGNCFNTNSRQYKGSENVAYPIVFYSVGDREDIEQRFFDKINEVNTTITSAESLFSTVGFTANPVALQVTQADAAGYIKCNNLDPDEGNDMNYLIDNNPSTFIHSNWHNKSSEKDYLEVYLGEDNGMSLFYFTEVTRSGAQADFASSIEILGSKDGQSFVPVTTVTGLPTSAGKEYTSPMIKCDPSYVYLRFVVTGSSYAADRPYFHMAEFDLYSVAVNEESVSRGDIFCALSEAIKTGKKAVADLNLDAMNSSKTTMEELILNANITYPFTLTTDDKNPVLYAIKSGRGDDYWFTYEDEKIALKALTLAESQMWYFKEVVKNNKVYLQFYPATGGGKAMSYSDVNDGAGKVVAQALGTTNYRSNWLLEESNGVYGLQTEGKENRLSNYGGTSNKMGFYSEKTPNQDGGTAISFYTRPQYPFELTTDDANPKYCGIKSGRDNDGKEWWYTYITEGADAGKILLSAYTGAKNQMWYFKEVASAKYGYALQLYPAAGEGKAMSYQNADNGAAKIFAQSIGTEGWHSTWVLETTNGAAPYGLQTSGKENRLSNNGGVGNKMGMWNASPSADAGSAMYFSDPAATLQTLIDEAKVKAGYGHEGEVGYYPTETAEALRAAIAQAEANKANKIYELTALKAATSAMVLILPEAGKYYQIKSANPQFYAKQGKEMGIYSSNAQGQLAWKALDATDKTFYWTITPKNEKFVLKNEADGKYVPAIKDDAYAMTETESEAAGFTLTWLAPGQFNIQGNGTMHMAGHSEGAGTSGRICGWNGGINSSSAWTIVEVEHPDLAAAKAALQNKIDELNQIISKAGMVGYYTADACEALKEPVAIALDVLNGGSITVADYTTALTTLNNNTASLDKTIVLPVDGNAYTFMNVMGETADAKRYYMKYVNGEKVSVSTSSEDASVFVCKKLRDGVYVFITADGKFLTWIGNDEPDSYKENDQILGYSSHYAAECNSLSDWNEITVKPNGEEAKDFGYLRLVARRKSGSTSAFIVNVNNRFDQASDSYWFNSTNSSAWILTEVNHTNTLEQEAALAETDATVAAIAHVTENGSKLGDGLGYSYYMDGEAKITTAAAAKTAINNATTAEAVEAIHESFELDVPQGGKFYRLKGISGNYIDASSIYNNANATSGQMSMKSEADANLAGTIFYLDEENHFLNYATGTYVRQTREIGNVGDAKGVWSFAESPRTPGTLALSCTTTGNAGQHLHDNAGNRADRCDRNCGDRHDWTVEEVTTLSVTVSAAGYATFIAPVAVTIPEGVTAYTGTVTVNGEWLTLAKIEGGVIPANTGVVLESQFAEGEEKVAKTFSFTITEDVTSIDSIDSDLVGSTAAVLTSSVTEGKVPFTLQKPGDVVVFMQFDGDVLAGSKAYLELDPTVAQSISIRFEGTTDIENVELSNQNSAFIYDLLGRRVEAITKGGIYIVNGKKVVVK